MREAPSTTAMRYVGDTGFVCLVDLNLEPADKHVRHCQCFRPKAVRADPPVTAKTSLIQGCCTPCMHTRMRMYVYRGTHIRITSMYPCLHTTWCMQYWSFGVTGEEESRTGYTGAAWAANEFIQVSAERVAGDVRTLSGAGSGALFPGTRQPRQCIPQLATLPTFHQTCPAQLCGPGSGA